MEGALEAAQSIGGWTAPALLAGGLIVQAVVIVHLYQRVNALIERLIENIEGSLERAERSRTEIAESAKAMDRALELVNARHGGS